MHELQQILLKKIPRLGEITFWCEVIVTRWRWKPIAKVCWDRDDENVYLCWTPDKNAFSYLKAPIEELEILWHPFTHADILEALGEDWAMLSNWQLVMVDDNDYFVPCYFDGMRDVFYPKLPSNLSDLSLPEYEETRKQLIQLLTK